MTTTKWCAALLAATALTTSVSAQDVPADAPMTAEESAAQLEFLKAQVEAMQAQIEGLKKQTIANTPSFKAAPELTGSGGWRFKVRGRFMYDSAYTENPGNRVATKDLGFSTRVRRVRIGVEGAMPGGFGYKSEIDFANAAVGFGDVILTYRGTGDGTTPSPFEFTIGHFESLDGLEQITSSRFISFVERAQFNEGFNNTRRLGAAATFISPDNALRISAGAFNDTINADRGFNDEYILAARATYSPQLFGGQFHFGANYQHRKNQTAPTTGATNGLNFNYQVRPFTQNTDTRFVGTGAIASRGDDIYGLEFISIFGPLHFTAEGQYTKVDALRPTAVLTGGDVTNGTRYLGDPGFLGFYAEAGYWLTGETRGYRNGLWDRTKVLNPFDKGGWGALQVNVRYDYLDLSDRVGGPLGITAPTFVNGGTQTGYLASVIWQPIDYVRFTFQYTRGEVEGGPRAAAIRPLQIAKSPADRSYGYNVGVVRAAFDF